MQPQQYKASQKTVEAWAPKWILHFAYNKDRNELRIGKGCFFKTQLANVNAFSVEMMESTWCWDWLSILLVHLHFITQDQNMFSVFFTFLAELIIVAAKVLLAACWKPIQMLPCNSSTEANMIMVMMSLAYCLTLCVTDNICRWWKVCWSNGWTLENGIQWAFV